MKDTKKIKLGKLKKYKYEQIIFNGNQELFQGEKYLNTNKDYFEGWYFKNTNNEEGISFIPGINIDNKNKKG